MPKPIAPPVPSVNSRANPQARAVLRNLTAKTLTYFARHEVAHLRQMSEHLLDMAQSVSNKAGSEAYELRSISFLLDKQAAVPSSHYQDALKNALQDEIKELLEPPAQPSVSASLYDNNIDGMTLSLIDETEMDQLLSVDQVSGRFNGHYEARLTPLNERLGMLVSGQVASLSGNPFRPEVLIRALMAGWKSSGFDPAVCKTLLHSLVPKHAIDLAPLYDDLAATLTQAGVTVKTTHRIRKAADGDGAGGGGAVPGTPSGRQPASSDFGAASGFGVASGFERQSDFNLMPLSQPAADISGYGPISQSAGLDSDFGDEAPSASAPLVAAPRSSGLGHSAYGRLGQSLAAQARQFLQRLGFGHAGPGGAASAMVQAPVDPGLLGYLGGLQADAGAAFVDSHGAVEDGAHNVLRRMRDQEAIQQATEIDRGTVDALAEVFDYVFADPGIAPQLKVIIGRLQIPVLKAAMIDREFFHSAEHPARKLIDALAQAAVAWNVSKGEGDPLYLQIESTVQRALTEFEDDLSLFEVLLLEFEEFRQRDDQSAEQQIAPVADAQKSDEALALARAHADEIIHGRINIATQNHPLAPLLAPFLTNQWREVLAQAWLEVRKTPERWNEALSAVDKLIWSTQPQVKVERRQRPNDLSPHPRERRQLMQVLPELIRKIEIGLDTIGWTGRPRAEFMHGLMELHMQVVRTAAPSPEELAQRDLEAQAAADALRELEERRTQAQMRSSEDLEAQAKALTRGMWFDYLNDKGQVIRCRLSWISPKRTRMLFTNREGFDAFVYSEREVVELLRDQRLAQIVQTPIVGRALDQIMANA